MTTKPQTTPQPETRQWCGKEYRRSPRGGFWQVKDARRGTWKKLTNQYIIAALELDETVTK